MRHQYAEPEPELKPGQQPWPSNQDPAARWQILYLRLSLDLKKIKPGDTFTLTDDKGDVLEMRRTS